MRKVNILGKSFSETQLDPSPAKDHKVFFYFHKVFFISLSSIIN